MNVYVLVIESDNGRYGTDSSVAGVYSTKEFAEQARADEYPDDCYYIEEFKVNT